MKTPDIQQIRDWFDVLFVSSADTLKDTERELFAALGIDWFADIYMRSKKYGFAASQKVLADLVKVSFVVYQNLDKLPIQRKVILPEKEGAYKFIVTSFPEPKMAELLQEKYDDKVMQDTNTIALVSTWDDMHAKIAAKCGVSKMEGLSLAGGAWLRIDRQAKQINVYADSGSYGSCSNQLVERLLEDYKKEWYEITIDMTQQREFFTDEHHEN